MKSLIIREVGENLLVKDKNLALYLTRQPNMPEGQKPHKTSCFFCFRGGILVEDPP